MELSQDVVYYAKGLPLALETLGSFLIGRTIGEWQSALDNFKKIPKREIFEILGKLRWTRNNVARYIFGYCVLL